MSVQLSCGDTYQIQKWFIKANSASLLKNKKVPRKSVWWPACQVCTFWIFRQGIHSIQWGKSIIPITLVVEHGNSYLVTIQTAQTITEISNFDMMESHYICRYNGDYEVSYLYFHYNPDSKVHGSNMGPTRCLLAPGGPHVGLMNLVNREVYLTISNPTSSEEASGDIKGSCLPLSVFEHSELGHCLKWGQ